MAAIKGFNCFQLSCKKKYESNLNEYKTHKRADKISGFDRKQEYKYFTIIDI